MTIPASAKGVGLAIIPIGICDFLIKIFLTGEFLQRDYGVFDCGDTIAKECILTIFDLIKDDPDNISVDYDGLRTGRTGTALLVSGTYMMVIGLSILIPDTSD